MMKTLILKSNKTDFESFYIDHMKTDCVDVYPIYRCNSGILWYAAVILIEKLGMIGSCFFDKRWRNQLDRYDTVIVFDRNLNWNIFDYLKKRNPRMRCIAWYWNPIMNKKRRYFPPAQRQNCEVWSFDKNDCEKYNFQNNVQFYFKNLCCDNSEPELFALFVGCDKGRYCKVVDIANKLQLLGKQTFVGVVADKASDPSREYVKEMSYSQIIKMINSCDCIIDVPQQKQEGITLRVLEALFWKKKLITTNDSIKDYEFYNESNILIWDNPSDETILRFVNASYEKISDDILEKYTYERWLKNFGISVE